MRTALATLVLAIGCSGRDGNLEVCRKDAQRWGECIGQLTADPAFGAEVQQALEAKITRCAARDDEVAIARRCASVVGCDAWQECWGRRQRAR